MALLEVKGDWGRIARALERIAEALERAWPRVEGGSGTPPSPGQLGRIDYREQYRERVGEMELRGDDTYEYWPTRPRK